MEMEMEMEMEMPYTHATIATEEMMFHSQEYEHEYETRASELLSRACSKRWKECKTMCNVWWGINSYSKLHPEIAYRSSTYLVTLLDQVVNTYRECTSVDPIVDIASLIDFHVKSIADNAYMLALTIYNIENSYQPPLPRCWIHDPSASRTFYVVYQMLVSLYSCALFSLESQRDYHEMTRLCKRLIPLVSAFRVCYRFLTVNGASATPEETLGAQQKLWKANADACLSLLPVERRRTAVFVDRELVLLAHCKQLIAESGV